MSRIVDDGELVLLTSGEYSDYGVQTLVRVLKRFDFAEVIKAYFAEGRDKGYNTDQTQFVGWLCAKEYVVEVEFSEVHLGSYGRLEVQS